MAANDRDLAVHIPQQTWDRRLIERESKELKTLTVKQVHKHTKIKLGPKIDVTGYPSKTSLFAISNRHGWFFAGHKCRILASPIADLRTVMGSNSGEEETPFDCKVDIDASPETPICIKLVMNNSKLVVASSSKIAVWDVDAICAGQKPTPQTFELKDLVIVDLQPNPHPTEAPHIVTVLASGHSHEDPNVVLLYDVVANVERRRFRGLQADGTAPLTVQWSPDGSLLAMGTYGGILLVYSAVNFAEPLWAIPRPNNQQLSGTSIIHMNWLIGSTWHIVYATPRNPDSLDDYQPEEYHYVIMAAPDQRSCLDSRVDCPYDPYGLPREPGGHGVVLRGWTNIEYLLLASDARATDVGAVVALPPAPGQPFGDVFKVDMTESSMTIPLDADAGETTILGMDLDLTGTQPLHSSNQAVGDDPELPPMPIIFFYNNDGVVSAYHIINEAGHKYPGMRSPDISAATSTVVPPLSTFMPASPPTNMPPSQPSTFTAAPTAPTGFAAFAQNKAPTPFGASTTAFGNSVTTPSTGFGFGGSSAPIPAISGPKTDAPKFGQLGFGSGAAGAKPFGGFSSFTAAGNPAPSTTSAFSTQAAQDSSLALKPATGGFASLANSGTGGSFSSFSNTGQGFSAFPKPAQTNEQKPTGFGAFTSQPATTTATFGTPTAFSQPKSVFGQPLSVFGKPAFVPATLATGDSDKKPAPFSGSGGGFSAFSKPAGGAATGSGFGAFAGGFASLASAASSTTTPAFAEAGSGDEIKTDNVLVFGQSQKKEEVKPFTSLAGPTQAFGSGTTNLTSAFSSFAPRAAPRGDEDEENKGNVNEAFPADTADKLEPTNVHTGPDLFGIPNMSTFSTSSLQSRLGQVALSGDKKPPTLSKEEKRITTAFGQIIDPDAKPSSLWASAAGGSGAASAFLNTKPGSNKPPFGPFSSQAAGQSSSAFRSSGSAFAPYEPKRDSERGSDGGEVLSESEEGTKTMKGLKNKDGYLTPDEEDVDEEEDDDEEEGEEEEGDGDEGEEEEEDLAEVSDEEDEGLPVVEEDEEEEEESGSAHEEDDTGEPVLSSTPTGGIKTTFQWKQGALDNATNAKPASSPSQKIPWQGSSGNFGISRAKASSPSPLPQVTTSTESKPANSVITPVTKLATPLFGGSDAQSARNAPTKISARPKTPPGLFGAEPTITSAISQSDLQSKMVNITPIGSTTPKPQPAPPRSKYQELQDQLNAMLANALGHNDELEKRAVSLRSAMEKSRNPAMRPKTTQEDLETSVWTFGDLPAMSDTIRSSEGDLLELVDAMFTVQKGLADLQRLVLKTEMKREEVDRFLRAKDDRKFAEMIKVRTLGPEHTENQLKLRKCIQTQRDRVIQFEEHVQQLKKKVDQARTGKRPLQAPTLDVILRTIRNIDIAVREKTEDLDTLEQKMDELQLDHREQLSQKKRLPLIQARAVSAARELISAQGTTGTGRRLELALAHQQSLKTLQVALMTSRKVAPLNQTADLGVKKSARVVLKDLPPPAPGHPVDITRVSSVDEKSTPVRKPISKLGLDSTTTTPKIANFPTTTPTSTSASTIVVALQQAAQRLSNSPSVSPPVPAPASASTASFSPGEGRLFSRAVRNPRGHGTNERHTPAAQIRNRITTPAADTGGFSFGPPPPITLFDTKNGFIPFSNIPSIRTGPVYVPPNDAKDDKDDDWDRGEDAQDPEETVLRGKAK